MLCNVNYKIFTKILVNRLRPLFDKIVDPAQSSFFIGRQTLDNIIISQEIVHTLERKKGKNGGLIFKTVLEKAYDKASWDFIETVLTNINFSDNCIKLIISCIIKR